MIVGLADHHNAIEAIPTTVDNVAVRDAWDGANDGQCDHEEQLSPHDSPLLRWPSQDLPPLSPSGNGLARSLRPRLFEATAEREIDPTIPRRAWQIPNVPDGYTPGSTTILNASPQQNADVEAGSWLLLAERNRRLVLTSQSALEQVESGIGIAALQLTCPDGDTWRDWHCQHDQVEHQSRENRADV